MARVTKAELSRLAARRAQAFDLHCQGWTQAKIGAKLGIDQQVVSHDLQVHRSTIPADEVDKVRQDHVRTLAMLRESMFELSQMDGAPVTAGKDGLVVHDPATGQVVRDYSLRVLAARETRALVEREAKLLGVDATAKVEVSGEIGIAGSIEQEIAKLAESLGVTETSTAVLPPTFAGDGLADQVGG